MNNVAELQQYLSDRIGCYFADLQSQLARVELRRRSERTNSMLYEFAVVQGPVQRHLLVKVPFSKRILKCIQETNSYGERDRPRLFPRAEPDEKGRLEFVSLAAIEQHIRALGDARFGAIRVFEMLPDGSTFVMERIDAVTLDRLQRSASRPQNAFRYDDLLERAFSHAGAWLRHYHHLPNLPHTQVRGRTRDELLASVDQFVRFLVENGSNPGYYRWLGEQFQSLAESKLPGMLPLGLGHGDYAPRNVLVDPEGRIQIIDTLGRWRSPIYEDLGRFLAALKVTDLQVWTQGLAFSSDMLQHLETRFLRGYFDREPIPLDAIRLFEMVALLERWVAFVFAHREARGWKRRVKATRLRLWNRFLTRYLAQMLHDLQANPTDVPILKEAV